ncbi:autophagy-related protein 21 [Suhomyces tanzawaensis NRRL Y-17324]|uniref:Autophagy-related protein 21 n=1 Tax=Suhomyces tanzawaensis NRRL Y-17324 TaxID=984487 RepID=A0A1E4SLG0_9ASCO|nr:autophagy-related protein 21 [Suhomyces tanzawaensis NRRL Y-17324]ODV80346.1 autophagy-related protein 21 [Suhomyces tanzawaensis NRRL Y-17324]
MVVINDLTLNQDCSCISISTNEYHKIFNCEPFGEFYTSQSLPQQNDPDSATSNDSNQERPATNRRDSLIVTDSSGPKNPTAFLKMLFSTSLTIIIPQSTTKLGNRLLKIYNLKQNLKICELTFPSSIVNVRLNRKRLVVFLEIGQIYVYDLSCVRLIKVLEINTYGDLSLSDEKAPNSELVGDLSPDDQSYLLLPVSMINDQTDLFNTENGRPASTSRPGSQPSTPVLQPSDSTILSYYLDSLIALTHKNDGSSISKRIGQGITLEDLKKDSDGWVLVYDTIKLKPKLIFKAHNSAIAKITISGNNRSIATASVKGTIIRVFQLEINEDKIGISQVINLRRGHNLARINTLSFNSDCTILGCGSESNTIHFFKLNEEGQQHVVESDDESDEESRSEDLNDNLASLLVEQSTPKESEEPASYFSFNLKKTSKLINNHYTKSIIKRLPYKDYFDNLIWEPPRRSFAYIKLPEYTPPPPHSAASDISKNKVEIGFNANLILLASYQTGTFYQYQLPPVPVKGQKHKHREDDTRQECLLVNQYSLV